MSRFLTRTLLLLILVPTLAHAEPLSAVVFKKGVTYRDTSRNAWQNEPRDTVATFGAEALTLEIEGELRFPFRHGPKRTVTIPYADILSATLDEGPIHSYLVIRYRQQADGASVELDLSDEVLDRVIAMFEARSRVRIQPR